MTTARKRSRPKLPRHLRAPLPGPWSMFVSSLKLFRDSWKRYLLTISVVALPLSLLSLFINPASDATISSYVNLAAIIMNVVLVWAIGQHLDTGRFPSVADTYYRGSELIVRFLLVLVAITGLMIPAIFGVILLGLSVLASSYLGTAWQEVALTGVAAFILSIPSIWWMTRFMLALVVTAQDDLSPIRSLKASRRATLGYFWAVMGRFAAGIIFLAVLSIPTSAITFGLWLLHWGSLAAVVFPYLSTLIALPITYLYFFELYRGLKAAQERNHQTLSDSQPAEVEPPSDSSQDEPPAGSSSGELLPADEPKPVRLVDSPAEEAAEAFEQPAKQTIDPTQLSLPIVEIREPKLSYRQTHRGGRKFDSMSARPQARFQPSFSERIQGK